MKIIDMMNRRDVHARIEVPHTVKNEKHALEEQNTIVVPHKKESVYKKVQRIIKRSKDN